MPELVRLTFEAGHSAQDEFLTPQRGYRSDVTAELDDGFTYRVTFYDPVRLAQTLADDALAGSPYFSEPGLIVLPRVDLEHMDRAARELARAGFFDRLRPVDR